MEKQRINQKILCKRMDELEMAISELNTLEASEINKRLLKIENMLYAAKDTLTSQEAANYIGISLSQLYKLTSKSKIPYYKPQGKMVYFAKKELDEWMRQDHYPVITQDQLQELLEKSTIRISSNSKTTQKHSKQKDGKKKDK